MDERVKFSILIPNLGFNPFFKDCLISVLKQPSNNKFSYEVIICDQSDSETFNNIQSLIESVDNNHDCFLYHSEQKGLLKARHTLISFAKGEYVCFVDSDDFVSDDYLNVLFDKINDAQPDVVLFNFSHFIDKDTIVKRTFDKQLSFDRVKDYFYYSSTFNSIWSKCFKRSLYDKNDYYDFDTTNGEDWVFSLPIMKKATTFVDALDNYLYFYRDTAESLTKKFSYKTGEKQLTFRNDFYKDNNVKDDFQSKLFIKDQIKTFLGVASNLVFNKKVDYKKFCHLCLIVRTTILETDKIRDVSLLSKKQYAIYRLLMKKMYLLIYWLTMLYNRKHSK